MFFIVCYHHSNNVFLLLSCIFLNEQLIQAMITTHGPRKLLKSLLADIILYSFDDNYCCISALFSALSSTPCLVSLLHFRKFVSLCLCINAKLMEFLLLFFTSFHYLFSPFSTLPVRFTCQIHLSVSESLTSPYLSSHRLSLPPFLHFFPYLSPHLSSLSSLFYASPSFHPSLSSSLHLLYLFSLP